MKMPSRAWGDCESESLVARDGGGTTYTDGGANGTYGTRDDEEHDNDLREMDYVDTDVSLLSQFHEDALSQAGFGVFQALLFVVLGLALAADAIELFVIAYVMPSAERELCMDDSMKGWLAAISFIGMMIGGIVWGTFGDKIGRRKSLLSALVMNAAFSVATAFMPLYGLLLITRFFGGIGIGGSLPIVFTYYGEFLVKRNRGRHLSWLLMFWALGGVMAALMAWVIIPHDSASIHYTLPDVPDEFQYRHLSRWRIFLVVCSIPAIVSTFGLCFLPESPRFLLERGQNVEAMGIYQRVFKMNHHSEADYQLSELELPTGRMKNSASSTTGSIFGDMLEGMATFWNLFPQILCAPYTRRTLLLLVVWTTTAFGFYGISIWFPEYIRKLEQEEYESRAALLSNISIANKAFTSHLENTRYENVNFSQVRFEDLFLNHCQFENCTFLNCTFDNVRSSVTHFMGSKFQSVTFKDTDLYDYRFIQCTFISTIFRDSIEGCGLDFDVNYNMSSVFLQNLIAQVAIIPGNFVSSYILDRMGRVKTLGTSLILSSLSTFFIWFLNDRTSVIVFEAIFNFISISGWNAVDVITTESYPATLRSTGYGFLSAFSRLAAIMGNITFAHYISVNKALPVLTTAIVLLIGGIFSMKLPETKDELM